MAELLIEAGKAKNIQVFFGRGAAPHDSRRQPPRRLFFSARHQAESEVLEFSDSSVGASVASSLASDDGRGGTEVISLTDSDSEAELVEAPRPPAPPARSAAGPSAAEEEILGKVGKRPRREYQRVKDGLPGNDKADFRDIRNIPPQFVSLIFRVVLECPRVPLLDLKVLLPAPFAPAPLGRIGP